MKNVVYQDLYQFNFLSDPVVSPDGTHAIFTKQNAVEDSNSYTAEIWIMDLATKEYHPLTTGGKERGGFWIDADNVAFVANRDGNKAKGTTWYKINIHGGEAQPWLTANERAGQIKLIDDETYIYTVNRNSDGDPKKEEDKAKEGEEIFVFEEFPFWFNGRKVINKKRNALVLHQNGEDKTLTPQYMNVQGLQLSPDKTKIVYGGSEYTDVQSRTSGMYLYEIATGETKTRIPQGDLSVGSF